MASDTQATVRDRRVAVTVTFRGHVYLSEKDVALIKREDVVGVDDVNIEFDEIANLDGEIELV